MISIGLDIGTTSVCGVVLDGENGKILESRTLINDSALSSKYAFERIQSPERIFELCTDIYSGFIKKYPSAALLGVTGQMHGILYLSAEGVPLSPLYTWQDGRGNEIYKNGKTYAEALMELTGYQAASGFGMVTHFYNLKNKLIPEGAAKLCTIHDYAAMKFACLPSPRLHPSDGASLGVYDLKKDGFDTAALKKAGVDADILPEIALSGFIGKTKEGLSVALAIGDNQASVLGSLKDENSVLVNVGTGSQVSVISNDIYFDQNIETRPFIGGKYLITSCPLCGGYSYSLLRDFYKKTLDMFGVSADNIYDKMDAGALSVKDSPDPLIVSTRFKGTRENTSARGYISNIGVENFTPGHLTLGVLNGICGELYEGYLKMTKKTGGKETLVGSGNGIRKNPLLQRIFSERFNLNLQIPLFEEEAAYGGALFAICESKGGKREDISGLIGYRS